VRIDLARTADRYVIEVVDHGPGIAPDAQSHIFERVYRGPDSRLGARSDGAGLGLSLARWIARVHGGDVRLTQSTPSGSRFTVELPFISRS
jgi:signal transduction histidine kinase